LTNRELLTIPKEHLGALDRQRQHILTIELTPMPCPACQKPVDSLTAAGIDIDAYKFGEEKLAYHCPHCHAQLEHVVPFIAIGPGWHWQLKHEWLTEMLAKAWTYDRDIKEDAIPDPRRGKRQQPQPRKEN
jgi:hypothetical protein